jgi:hypothetical protein
MKHEVDLAEGEVILVLNRVEVETVTWLLEKRSRDLQGSMDSLEKDAPTIHLDADVEMSKSIQRMTADLDQRRALVAAIRSRLEKARSSAAGYTNEIP